MSPRALLAQGFVETVPAHNDEPPGERRLLPGLQNFEYEPGRAKTTQAGTVDRVGYRKTPEEHGLARALRNPRIAEVIWAIPAMFAAQLERSRASATSSLALPSATPAAQRQRYVEVAGRRVRCEVSSMRRPVLATRCWRWRVACR